MLRGIILICSIYFLCRVDLVGYQVFVGVYEYPTSIFLWHCVNAGYNILPMWYIFFVFGYIRSLERARFLLPAD